MRVLVTGSTGYLGQHLSRALYSREVFVVGLVRDLTGSRFPTTSVIVRGDLDSVERIIAEYELDTVVHLAAQVQVSTAVADPIGTLEANVQGTWKVLEACRRQKVKRVIVASSDKAYGAGKVPYEESQDLQPSGIYATSKLIQDVLAQSYAQEYKMSVAVTRCGNLYGPGHTNWSTLIPGTIRSVLRKERPVLRSDGGPERDWLYVEDAVDGYLRLAASDAVGAFNFGTGRGTSALDVVRLILKLMESELEPSIESRQEGPVEIQEQILDCSKAYGWLLWKAQHSLEQGLEKTIKWYRDHL